MVEILVAATEHQFGKPVGRVGSDNVMEKWNEGLMLLLFYITSGSLSATAHRCAKKA